MGKNLILTLILGLFLISTVSAITYKQHAEVDFKESCTRSEAICSPSVSCNVSFKFPNNTYLISNGIMTNQGNGDFNYTISSDNSNVVGEYTWDMYCCEGSTCGEDHNSFTITPTGRELTTGESVIYVILLFGALILLGTLIYASARIPWRHPRDGEGLIVGVNNQKVYKIGAVLFSYLTLMWIFGILRLLSDSFLLTSGTTKFFSYFYLMMLYMAYPLAILSIVIGIVVWIASLKLTKQLQRGFEVR